MMAVSDSKVCGGGWWWVCKPISVLSFDQAEQYPSINGSMLRTGLAKVMMVGMMADCIKLGVVGITSAGRAHGHSN